jgi:hypothetical protein
VQRAARRPHAIRTLARRADRINPLLSTAKGGPPMAVHMLFVCPQLVRLRAWRVRRTR